MNVILLSQFLSTTKGGGEYVFSIIAKLLADNGHKVWIITNKVIGEKYPPHENIKFIFVPPLIEYKGGHPPGFKDNIIYSIGAFRAGFSIIRKEKIDILQSNNFAPALAGSILSILTSKPHITVIHDVFSYCKDFWNMWGKQENVSRLNVLLGPYFERMIIRLKCAAIHTVSEASRDDLVKFGAKKPIYVIHNAVYIDKIEESKSDPCQFIYIGRLVFYKNLEVVIRAVNILKESYSNLKLVITGDGPHKKKLVELIENLNLKEKVIFTKASAHSFSSDAETIRPVLLFSTTSDKGLTSETMTGFLNAKASNMTRPNPSQVLGNTIAAEVASSLLFSSSDT